MIMINMMRLIEWEKGIRIESRSDSNLFAFLWFYEWHLFDAIQKGEHTHGISDWKWTIDDDGTNAHINSEWLKLKINATQNGAKLVLEIINKTSHSWPPIAAIIPCFNPGNPENPLKMNPLFLDEGHAHTYFQGKNGLELIKGRYPREIHFNNECQPGIMAWDKEQEDRKFIFDEKWPTSERDAYAGLIVRESDDMQYVMGIGWESYLSAQGHNPWNCMHLSIKVGPLAPGEKKTINGRIYLFKGLKEDCLQEFVDDFS